MGDLPKRVRVSYSLFFFVCDTPTQCPLQRSSIMKISRRVIELWPAQDFITIGDNSRMQSVRVVFLVCNMPTQCPLPKVKYHENTLKGFRVMGRTSFNN